MGRSHQQHLISQPAGTSPTYLRPPSSGAGTFLPQAGGQPERERRRRRSREGGAPPPTALDLPARGTSPSYHRGVIRKNWASEAVTIGDQETFI